MTGLLSIPPMRISDDEARALAFIAALIALTALGRWVDRPRAELPEVGEASLAALALSPETTVARPAGSGPGSGVKATSVRREPAREVSRVPPIGPPARSSPQPGTRPPASPASPLDINRATAAELEELPGVGPALAARILARRDSAGPFRTLAQLDSVRGVGPSLLARLKPLLRLAR
jgi:competence ComEA-like helix-hairpin-helix protein